MSDRNEGGMIVSFLLGGIIGAALGLLFAPQSGKKTRAKVADLMNDMGEKGKDLAEKGEKYLEKQKDKFFKKEKSEEV